MGATSTKPYLGKAIWEWCEDNGLTPLIQVKVEGGAQVLVPLEHVTDGQIVLNISSSATRNLVLGLDAIQFSARFGGRPRDVFVPWSAVLGVYARESGEGMLFSPEDDPDDDSLSEQGQGGDETIAGRSSPSSHPVGTGPVSQKKPTLTVIK